MMQKKEKCLFLVDDENRENEGDLLYLLQKYLQNQLILWQNMEEV